jgi:hypothetical protein
MDYNIFNEVLWVTLTWFGISISINASWIFNRSPFWFSDWDNDNSRWTLNQLRYIDFGGLLIRHLLSITISSFNNLYESFTQE